MQDVAFVFPKPKPKPVILVNEMPQSIRVEAKFTDEGLEITLVGRHERLRGQPLPSGERIKMEEEVEEIAPTG